MKIAVVGAGVSGLVSAYLLFKAGYEVELFERDAHFGGHAHTVRVPGSGSEGEVHLDTGFVVYNEPAYPRFSRLLDELGVASQASDMSFSVSCRACGIEYSSRGLAGWLARPSTMLRPARLRFLWDLRRFYRDAPGDTEDPSLENVTLLDYLRLRGYGHELRRHFIVPLAAAVWSMTPGAVDSFPARYLLRFLYNHGLVGGGDRWRWRTVAGGSQSYVNVITSRLRVTRRSTPVTSVQRRLGAVTLRTPHGDAYDYDAVVLATHADEALAMLADPSSEEEDALRCFTYTKNSAVLHTDASFLPEREAARASWNYVTDDCRAEGADLALTYYLNRLQSVWDGADYCVSVNTRRAIEPSRVIEEVAFTHPSYSFRTLQGQARLAQINGSRRTYFAGAHLGYGFHEDGVESAYRVAELVSQMAGVGV